MRLSARGTPKLILGAVLLTVGVSTMISVFNAQQIQGRIKLWMLPIAAWFSDIPWHGPASTAGLITAIVGWRIARTGLDEDAVATKTSIKPKYREKS
jgi:hypothetical protein